MPSVHYTERLRQAIEQLNLHRDPEILGVYNLLKLGKLSELAAEAWLASLQSRIKAAVRMVNVLPSPPEQDELHAFGPPQVVLGKTETGLDWGLNPLRQVIHTIVAGATDTGKSSLLRRFVIELRKLAKVFGQDVVVVIIDPKRDFHDMRQIAEGRWLIVDAPSTLRYGNQPPPGVSADTWISILTTALEAHSPLVSGRNTVAKVMRILHRLLNASGDSNQDLWPSWRLILEAMDLVRPEALSDKGQYTQSAKQALSDLVLNSAQMGDCARGFELVPEVDGGTNVVVAVDQLTLPHARSLLVETIGSTLFYSALASGRKGSQTRVVLLIDEADEFVSAEQDKAHPIGLSPFGRILKQGREFGISVVLSVSVLRLVSPFVLSNCSNFVAFAQADPESVAAARKSLMLPPQADPMIASLPPGKCIARDNKVGAHLPFLVNVEYLPPYRGPVIQFDRHPFVPSKSLAEMPEVREAFRKMFDKPGKNKGAAKTDEGDNTLGEWSWKLLHAAVSHPYEPVARLIDRMGGLSPALLQAAEKELTDRKLAEFKRPRLGQQRNLLIEVTDEGYRFARQKPPHRQGKGGLIHRTVAMWIRSREASHGLECELEVVVPGTSHQLDAASNIGGGLLHGFEISVTAVSNLGSHMRACFMDSQSVSQLTIVTLCKRDAARISAQLSADDQLAAFMDRVDFITAGEVMKELWP